MQNSIELSASAIESFKACPTRFKLRYVDRIAPIEDTDAQRIGTNWHKLLEVLSLEPESVCWNCAKQAQPVTGCLYCGGTGFLPKNTMDIAIRFLWDAYTIGGMLVNDREVEYYTLLNALVGYNWYWASQERYKTIVREFDFEIPIRSLTGRALSNAKLRGKIDKIVQNENGQFLVIEHKSTSKSIDSDSTIWSHYNMGVQSYLYPGTAQQLQLEGELKDWGITPKDPPIFGVLFDVFHKPQISPKKLTQKASKEFVENVPHVYMGQVFQTMMWIKSVDGDRLEINGVPAEIELGKKAGTLAIRETPEMFGARLLEDISERPEFYFSRREVARTSSDFERFRRELLSIYQTIRLMKKNCGWYHNDQQCEATFRCPYISICYSNKDVSEEVPNGFRRI